MSRCSLCERGCVHLPEVVRILQEFILDDGRHTSCTTLAYSLRSPLHKYRKGGFAGAGKRSVKPCPTVDGRGHSAGTPLLRGHRVHSAPGMLEYNAHGIGSHVRLCAESAFFLHRKGTQVICNRRP